MPTGSDAQVMSDALEIVRMKLQWERAHAAGDQNQADAAVAIAAALRERIRSYGYGWLADAISSQGADYYQATQYLATLRLHLTNWYGFSSTGGIEPPTPPLSLADGIAGRAVAPHLAPVSGGTPGGGGQPTTLPPSTAPASGNAPPSTGGTTPTTPGGGISGNAGSTVGGWIGSVIGGINTGVQGGAGAVGGAAGGLAQTVVSLGKAVYPMALALLLVVTIGKILRLNLKVGGS